jgi:2-hydroxy-6-oxonona-2,4-dienedioate hydrolase
MKTFGLLSGVAISLVAIYFAISIYCNYRQEMRRASYQLSSNSEMLYTSLGPIEYSSAGHGDPVIVLHGAGGGYDEGLLISQAWAGDDFWRIAVSRFGYLRSPCRPSHRVLCRPTSLPSSWIRSG